MFQFIRNLFSKKPKDQDDDWDFDWVKDSSMTEWPMPQWPSKNLPDQLTQSDLQFLRHILTKHIRAADQVKKDLKEEALEYEVGDDLRNILFREHREIREYLKKLSALQYRLKHKIKVGS